MAENPRIEELRRRVQKDPASIAFAQLAEEYRRAGHYEEAVQVCRAGLAKHTAYLSARVTLGRALIELERYDDAQIELEFVLRSAPENLAAIRGLAEIHQRRGELEEALRRYRMALGIARHDPDIEESVNQLTRQLSPATSEPSASQPFADSSPPVESPSQVGELAENRPPIPLEGADASTMMEGVHASAEGIPLNAAADEFTRALEALDALTIDFQPPPLPAVETLELRNPNPSVDDQLVSSADWEAAGFDAAWTNRIDPGPPERERNQTEPGEIETALSSDQFALHELERWLDGILADRDAREKTTGR